MLSEDPTYLSLRCDESMLKFTKFDQEALN
jgi:hypothetical protein